MGRFLTARRVWIKALDSESVCVKDAELFGKTITDAINTIPVELRDNMAIEIYPDWVDDFEHTINITYKREQTQDEIDLEIYMARKDEDTRFARALKTVAEFNEENPHRAETITKEVEDELRGNKAGVPVGTGGDEYGTLSGISGNSSGIF